MQSQSMDDAGIDLAVVSLTMPGIEGIADTATAVDHARRVNDKISELYVNGEHRNRFRAFACVPLQDPVDAAAEVRRAVGQLGAVGVLVNGYCNIGDENTVQYLDEPQCAPFWDAIEEVDVPVSRIGRPSHHLTVPKGTFKSMMCRSVHRCCGEAVGTMKPLQVAVVGAGIGGLAAANALSDKGISVRVYEQARHLGEVGAGVAVGSNSLHLLERLGLREPLRNYGPRWTHWRFNDYDGRVLTDLDMSGRVLGMYRPDLIAMLTDSLPGGTVSTGRKCVAFEQDADRATLAFEDGGHVHADLVVAAAGIHSVLQPHVVAPRDPVFSGSIAYRGVIPADRVPDYPSTVSNMWMGEGKHFLVFTLRGGKLINFVGFVPSDAEMRESWSAPGDPAALAREFRDWDPMVRTIITHVDTTFRWGLYDREPLPRWSNGRLTLLGDAAHPMLPHMGKAPTNPSRTPSRWPPSSTASTRPASLTQSCDTSPCAASGRAKSNSTRARAGWSTTAVTPQIVPSGCTAPSPTYSGRWTTTSRPTLADCRRDTGPWLSRGPAATPG
ncbi:FAD-dependent monooxygenase [Mycolicibacterium sp. BK607]|uniref:FAD-dependent monooxygenase n=1 Tax=Mycolicibacterium sp. BK607 TaxID=2587098 RepID=UPI00351C6B14